MKRDIVFDPNKQGQLAAHLVSPERNAEFQAFISQMIDSGKSLQDVIVALNERGDMTDGEWTATIFALGYFQGTMGLTP